MTTAMRELQQERRTDHYTKVRTYQTLKSIVVKIYGAMGLVSGDTHIVPRRW